ncbi:histone-fold-containing protein, partial [Neurospora tetrasperma FGSC 2509]
MPPKKTDGTRRSDVSVARFVIADEDTTMATGEPALSANPASALAAAAIERDERLPPVPTTSEKQSTPARSTSASAAAAAGRASSTTGSAAAGGGGPTSPSESKRGGGGGGASEKDKEREREREREKERDAITIEDLTLPKSIITRLAKGVLPSNTQIQANAILAMTKSATVFISHLANAANEHTVSSGKKTIMPADVFKALDEIEYGFMREKLEAEFAKFNEIQTSKRSVYRKKVAAAKKAGGGGSVSGSGVGGPGSAAGGDGGGNEPGGGESHERAVGDDDDDSGSNQQNRNQSSAATTSTTD